RIRRRCAYRDEGARRLFRAGGEDQWTAKTRGQLDHGRSSAIVQGSRDRSEGPFRIAGDAQNACRHDFVGEEWNDFRQDGEDSDGGNGPERKGPEGHHSGKGTRSDFRFCGNRSDCAENHRWQPPTCGPIQVREDWYVWIPRWPGDEGDRGPGESSDCE